MEPTSHSSDLVTELWNELSGGPGNSPPDRPELVVTGPSGQLPSQLPVEEAAVGCVGLGLLAAAAQGDQNGPVPTVRVDRTQVAAVVRSERYFRRNGRPAGAGFAPLSRFWPTADGWLRSHANYPWHKAALLDALGTPDDPDEVGVAIRALPGAVVEERVFAAGGVAAAVRDADEWGSHPQGRALVGEALIGHSSLGDAPPRQRRARSELPMEGVRILDATRVIAGPVCTRFLGALGADVLRVDPPGHPDMRQGAVADTLLGKRSAALDLAGVAAAGLMQQLLEEADALVCGYRPGSLDRFGLGPDELAARHPGLVVVYLDAWGHTGPWAERRGFDSVVQAATGIAIKESQDEATPGALPCQLLDHGTGYLAAAAVLDGLRRQAGGGGTLIRHLSLARTALWLLTATRADHGEGSSTADRSDATPWLVQFEDRAGAVQAVGPPGWLDDRALRWNGPPAHYLADEPTWADR
jgi:hypothetical protein